MLIDPDALYERERRERLESLIDEATRAIGTGNADSISFDSHGNLVYNVDRDTYHASRGQALHTYEGEDRRAGRIGARDRCFGIAPGSSEPTESVRVTYRDGSSETRSVRDFRADPRPAHERNATPEHRLTTRDLSLGERGQGSVD
jgi:hypothetical protein